jgi:hypothetical protein
MRQMLILFFCAVFFTSAAQDEKKNKYPLVHVKDWKEKSYSVTEDFWASTQKEILSKISIDEFNKIKKYSNNEIIPDPLLQFDGDRMVPLDTLLRRLSSLKVYKVVDANMSWEGTDYGSYTVLAVPYQELYWDKTAKWDTVYFIIKSYVVEIKAN